MINELKAMAIFAEVIEKGSFAAAATALSLSPSVVSYHVSQLEKRIGAALIYRSTRHLSLTAEGELFYQNVSQMMMAAKQGIEQLNTEKIEPTGQLNLSLPSVLCQSPMIGKIADFAKKYPKVKLTIRFDDNRENIIAKGIDIAVRAGVLEDSSLKFTPLGEIKRVLVCTPELYHQYPTPKTIQDIRSWTWIKLEQLANTRRFLSPNKVAEDIVFEHQISVNSVEAMRSFCLQGLGLATLADFQVNELLASQELLQVLPDWEAEAIPLNAIWAANVSATSLTKKLIKFLVG
jgi:DNA-binding transcriptional LysR family regulator